MKKKANDALQADRAEHVPAASPSTLDHPCRQRILRSLREDGGQLNATELRARGCATCTLSCVTYHLGVLVESGLVRRLGAGSVRGRPQHVFIAT